MVGLVGDLGERIASATLAKKSITRQSIHFSGEGTLVTDDGASKKPLSPSMMLCRGNIVFSSQIWNAPFNSLRSEETHVFDRLNAAALFYRALIIDTSLLEYVGHCSGQFMSD